jgi:hypothetical protein
MSLCRSPNEGIGFARGPKAIERGEPASLEASMTWVKWLAVLPFLAMLIGTAFVNTVEPLVFGLPLVLAWLVIWVVLTAAIMAVIFYSDPANADAQDGDQGASR